MVEHLEHIHDILLEHLDQFCDKVEHSEQICNILVEHSFCIMCLILTTFQLLYQQLFIATNITT